VAQLRSDRSARPPFVLNLAGIRVYVNQSGVGAWAAGGGESMSVHLSATCRSSIRRILC